jgi:ATP-dependent Clp protease adaptor protein ClpS
MPETIEAPVIVDDRDLEELLGTDRPWVVIVWNDPVNLQDYVVYVFQKLFGYSRAKATKLMLEVHNDGKSAVAHGGREKAEMDVARLHAHGLWATMERDSA